MFCIEWPVGTFVVFMVDVFLWICLFVCFFFFLGGGGI